MTLHSPLSLFEKPTVRRIFIDTSAILWPLHVESKNEEDRQVAQAYEKYFTEFLHDCNCDAYINPLVWLEITNTIDATAMLKYWDGEEGVNPSYMRKTYTDHHVDYERRGIIQKIRKDAKTMTNLVSRMIRASGKISCAKFPGDTKNINFAKEITKNVKDSWMKNFPPADVFHLYFMKRLNIKVAVSQDKHFLDVHDIRVHRFDPV